MCAQYDSWCCLNLFFSTCDMPQHMAYKLPEDGYYYLRPYHYAHIARHQQFVSQWGGDVRNPYSHAIFERLEEELPLPTDEDEDEEPEESSEPVLAPPPLPEPAQ